MWKNRFCWVVWPSSPFAVVRTTYVEPGSSRSVAFQVPPSSLMLPLSGTSFSPSPITFTLVRVPSVALTWSTVSTGTPLALGRMLESMVGAGTGASVGPSDAADTSAVGVASAGGSAPDPVVLVQPASTSPVVVSAAAASAA